MIDLLQNIYLGNHYLVMTNMRHFTVLPFKKKGNKFSFIISLRSNMMIEIIQAEQIKFTRAHISIEETCVRI